MPGSPQTQPRDSRFGTALATLRDEVEHGRFRDADMLPGERDLADVLSISRTTLRRVLAGLVAEGLLTHRQGVGTFITRAPRPCPGPRVGPDATVRMRSSGLAVSMRETSRGLFHPTPDEVSTLGCSPAAQVVRVASVVYLDQSPWALERTVAPLDLLDDLPPAGGSLLEALAARGHRPIRSVGLARAALVRAMDAATLGISLGSATLVITRHHYLASGRCCATIGSVHRPDADDLIWEELPHDR